MRVFVSTLYRRNYGSVLQAFALQKKLQELGAEPSILERPVLKQEEHPAVFKRAGAFLKPEVHYGLLRKLKRLMQKKKISVRFQKMDQFIAKNADIVPFEICCEQCQKEDSIFLAGSDQVWTTLNHEIDRYYLFDYDFPAAKYSYAASTGISHFSEEKKAYYSDVLSDFKVLSFREKEVCKELRPLFTDKEVRHDVDPTLLYDGEFWKEFCSGRPAEEPYIFVYMLRPNNDLIKMAKKIAKEKACKIIYLGQFINHYKDVICADNPGVEEFLSYICHAETVITNSFHGTVFSVLFEKPFVSVYVESTSERAANLLRMIGLESRLVNSADSIDILNDKIDYAAVKERLNHARADSIGYLKRIIS